MRKSMKCIVEFTCDSDAFGSHPHDCFEEVVTVLRRLASYLKNNDVSFPGTFMLWDSNNIVIGKAEFLEDWHSPQ